MSYRVLHNRLNGRLTAGGNSFSYEVAKTQKGSNHWSVTENNRNNGRNVNFNNGNTNNNNKYNSNVVRPDAAMLCQLLFFSPYGRHTTTACEVR